MTRMNVEIDDELVERVMVRYQLTTKREAVNLALRAIADQPMSTEEMLATRGAYPDFEISQDVFVHDLDATLPDALLPEETRPHE